VRFVDLLGDPPHVDRCDCCYQPASVIVSEFDQRTRQVAEIHYWCDRHEHWWQRAIYNLRQLWEELHQ
jgi:hypothetical protein